MKIAERSLVAGALAFGWLVLVLTLQNNHFYLAAYDLLQGGAIVARLALNLALALAGAFLIFLPFDFFWRRGNTGTVTPAIRVVAFLTIALFLAVCNATLEADDIKLLLLRGCLLVGAAHALFTRPAALLPARPVLIAALAWLAWLAVNATAAHHPSTALRFFTDQVLFLLGFAAVGSLPAAAGDDGRAARAYLLRLLALLFALASLHALLQSAGLDFLDWQGTLLIAGEDRVASQATSIFGNPNFLGTLALLGAVGAAFTLAEVRRPAARTLFGLALLLNAAGVFISYSRAAWLAGAAAAAAAALYAWHRRRNAAGAKINPLAVARRLAVPAALLLALLYWQHDLVAARLRSFTQPGRSITARVLLYKSAFSLWGQRPLLGWGANNFQFVFDRAIDRQFFLYYPPSRDFLRHTHNEFLQLLAETGLPGLAAWLTLLYAAARSGSGRGRNAVLAAAAVILTTDLFGLNLRYPQFAWLLWLLLALAGLNANRAGAAATAAPRGVLPLLLLVALLALLLFVQPFYASAWARLALLQPRTTADGQFAARLLLRRALEYEPAQPVVRMELASLYSAANDDARARAQLLALRELSLTFGNSDYRLARLELRAGNTAAAAEHYARAIQLEPALAGP